MVTLTNYLAPNINLQFSAMERIDDCSPKWWQNLKSTTYHHVSTGSEIDQSIPTIRQCYAINEFFKKAIIILAWNSYRFEISDKDIAPPSSNNPGSLYSQHPRQQFPTLFPNWIQVKLHYPGLIDCSEPMQFLITKPFYHLTGDEAYEPMPGYIEFTYQNHLNINLMFPSDQKLVDIPAGGPLAYLVPLSANKINLVTDTMTEKQMGSYQEFEIEHNRHRIIRQRNNLRLCDLVSLE